MPPSGSVGQSIVYPPLKLPPLKLPGYASWTTSSPFGSGLGIPVILILSVLRDGWHAKLSSNPTYFHPLREPDRSTAIFASNRQSLFMEIVSRLGITADRCLSQPQQNQWMSASAPQISVGLQSVSDSAAGLIQPQLIRETD
ncbi:MAG: hypothetical protein J3Q66DRAFT_372699 [Benniella sp.]|nr:MAG: hypothetical protein J3Q66DRAFT_372699 [Benniella sp.]